MKNITNIKIPITNVSAVLIFNDDTSTIRSYDLVGNYGLRNAEKFLLSEDCKIDLANVKTLKVIEVNKDVERFEVDTIELYDYLKGRV